MRTFFRALCEILGEGANVILKAIEKYVDDPHMFRKVVYTISGGEGSCIDFPVKELASDEELYERIPKVSVAFYKAVRDIGGEDAVYALLKSIARYYVSRGESVEEVIDTLSKGAHKPRIETEKKGDTIEVHLYLVEENVDVEALKEATRGTITTLLYALVESGCRDIAFVERRRESKGHYVYVYKIMRWYFIRDVRSVIRMMIGTRV